MALAAVDIASPLGFREKLRQFDSFTGALCEINRQVMTATFLSVHALRDHGPGATAALGMPDDLARDMWQAMELAARGGRVSDEVKRDLYERHFRWEQKRVVGAILQDCFDQFSWTLMRNICLRPWVWFAYFRPGRSLNFRNFMDEEERVQKGLAAFDRASQMGWARVERRFRLALMSLGRRPLV